MSNTGQLEQRIEGQLKMLEIAGRRIEDLEAQVNELNVNIHDIMAENMTLNIKVIAFERMIRDISDTINEGVE